MLISNIKIPSLNSVNKILPLFNKKDKLIIKTFANAVIYPIVITFAFKNILLGIAFIILMAVLYSIKYKESHWAKELFFNMIKIEIIITVMAILLIIT